MLESVRRKTRPRQLDLYDIFCAILYVLTEGCRWRSLPHDYPKWQIVYYYFRTWSGTPTDGMSVLDKVREELVMSERVINGRNPEPSMLIVDSRSTKNAFTAEEKGYDDGKKNIGH
jgi:transposase